MVIELNYMEYANDALAQAAYVRDVLKSLDFEYDLPRKMAYAPDSASLSITGDLTIEVWIKIESLGRWQQIASKVMTAAGVSKYSYEFILSNADKMIFRASSDGSAAPTGTADTTLVADTWYHLAVSYDASAGTCQFYLNGSTDGSGAGLDNSIQDNDSELGIGGQRSSDPVNSFDGKIAEVRIWNDIRTSGEISGNKDKELTGSEANLVAYYKLNDFGLDETTNDNDLTLVNGPVYSTDVPFETIQSYSESTIITQGSYSLKGMAKITPNKSLTKTFSVNKDLSGQDVIKLDVRASRTGTNIQVQIHDTGGTTTTHDINIALANVFQTEEWDISGVADADKDDIDTLTFKVTNADSDNTFYIDNCYAEVVVVEVNAIMFGCNF